MDSEKLLATYSLLAAIKEGEENKASDSLLNVFIPLVKKAMNEIRLKNNMQDVREKNLSEIQNIVSVIFDMTIPIEILRKILLKIGEDNNGNFILNTDNLFIINKLYFTNIDKLYSKQETHIRNLKKHFKTYCNALMIPFDFDELVKFIQGQQLTLFENVDNYLLEQDYHISKYIADRLKLKDKYYHTICDIYRRNNFLLSFNDHKKEYRSNRIIV